MNGSTTHIQSTAQSFLHRIRLIHNLFQQEMLISALLNRRQIRLYLFHFRRYWFSIQCLYFYTIFANRRHFSVIQINRTFRMPNQRRRIRRDQCFIVTNSDYEWRATPRYYNFFWAESGHHCNTVRTFH